jgi:lysophospholipase L1-like esterase
LLVSSVSPVLAIPREKLLDLRKPKRLTILLQDQQNQQLPITHYLALGDSLAYGFQPNDDHTHGYVDDLSTALQSQGVTNHVNLGCAGETTSTFLSGGKCSYPVKSQLAAALAYLQQVPAGQATLVTLDIGANDILGHMNIDMQNKACTVAVNLFKTDLQAMDQNLTQNILPKLHAALIDSDGQSTGNLVLLNYYNPFQNICPNTLSAIQTLNEHLEHDIQGFGTLVDIFGAFGGSTTPNSNLCSYTWMCSAPPLGPDMHPTTQGYQVMASAIENQDLSQVKSDVADHQDLSQVVKNAIDNSNLSKLLNGLLNCQDSHGCKVPKHD